MLYSRALRLCFSRCSDGIRLISTTVRRRSDFYFTAKHEWIKVDECAKLGTVGISEYAEQKLGDIVFVELPEKDDKVTFDEQCGVVESVKAVSEIYSPASGTVVEINSELESNPSVINKSPTEDGELLVWSTFSKTLKFFGNLYTGSRLQTQFTRIQSVCLFRYPTVFC
ncbi:hypothetical protein AHF37_03653 [Paragonimus kellicotti]|nr:hypothetical protein AHF37_03653 [Paragonimus kellicotti]